MTTVRDLLQEGKCQLDGFESPRLEAEILLMHTLGVSRAWLFAHSDQTIEGSAADMYRKHIQRRQGGEPIAYITGTREFWSLDFKVSPAVLIPRPETEILIEAALARIPKDDSWRLADLGTGSGAIAIAIATQRPLCEVHACDISSDALAVAQENANTHKVERIQFHKGSWLNPLSGKFDLIVSNPPYVAEGDTHLQQGDLRFEPDSALVSGNDGLEAIREITAKAPNFLTAGGWLGFEHGYDQAASCKAIMESHGFISIETLKDLQGTNRVTIGRLER